MIICRTPFRISFFGGGTDYPTWYSQYGGSVLATTVDKYCYLSCRYLPPFFEHRTRIVYSRIENCKALEDIQHPVVRETLRYLNISRGVEVHYDGDLPARSGMGTSSSFTVGLLHALHALKGQMPSNRQLALESMHLEQEVLHETVGSQDQTLAAYGGFNHIIFHQDGEISVRPLTLPAERINELNDHLMLVYTGIQRTASHIAESYVQDIASKEQQLRSMMEMVEAGVSALSNGQDITCIGELLHQAWQAKRSVSPAISNSHVDEIYLEARRAGAIGGKLLGAGGGGFMLLFVPPSYQSRVMERLKTLIHVPFRFETSGSQIVFFELEQDYSAVEEYRANQWIRDFQELTEMSSALESATNGKNF